jgi:WD40 repeat protein
VKEPAPQTDVSSQPRLDREHPWPALLAFRENDQRFFGGRKEQIEALYRRIASSRLTLLFGLSGLGKSSLFRAGLFPRLRGERYFPVYIRLRYGRDAPAPTEQIKTEIVAQAGRARIEAPEPRAGETLWQYFHRPDADFWDDRNHPTTPVLVFDQFEELFTKGREVPEQVNEVIETLADLAEGPSPALMNDAAETDRSLLRQVFEDRYRLLIGIRSDYLAQLQAISDRVRAVFANRYELHRMSGAAALESTLTAGGHLMDEDVARRIVRFIAGAGEDGDTESVEGLEVEPALLSLVCSELNATRLEKGEPTITASMLSGTKDEILSRFYETSFADVSPELRELVEDKLVTRDGKGRNFISEQTARETPGVEEEDLAKLVHRRLLRFEESGSSRRMELTHDLLTAVAAASRSTREQRRQLDESERAREEAEEREASARRKLRRSRAAMLVFLVLLGAAVAGPFLAARWTAIGAKKVEADSAFRLALQKLTSEEPSEGLAYLARVIRLDPGNSAARTLLYQQLVTRSWPVPVREFGPEGRIDAAVFSEDGARVAFRLDKMVEMWDVASGKRIGAVEAEGDIKFGADGWTILFERNVAEPTDPALWNPRLGPHPITFKDLDSCAGATSDVSRSGEEVVLSGCDEVARIVSPRGERPPESLLSAGMGTASFFPDPRFLLLRMPFAGGLAVFDRQAAEGRRLRTIPGAVDAWAMSADGQRVLVLADKGPLVWDVRNWTSLGKPFSNPSDPQSAGFDPAGSRVMILGVDEGIRTWNVDTGAPLFEPLWLSAARTAGFSVDRSRIFAASDRASRWWNARDGNELGEPLVQPKMLAAHLDGRGNIVTVSTRARVWELVTAVLPPLLPIAENEWLEHRLMFSANRKIVLQGGTAYDTMTGNKLWTVPASASGDLQVDRQFSRAIVRNGGVARVVDAKSWRPLWTLPNDVASGFSEDGTAILIQGPKETQYTLLSAATGKPVALRIDEGGVFVGASRDGSLLAMRIKRKLEVWDVRHRRAALVHEDDGVRVAFSNDGRRLATVSPQEGLRVWDVATGKGKSAKWDQREKLLWPTFSPDGQRLAVTSENGVVLCDVPSLVCSDETLAHERIVWVEFSADGRRILTATDTDMRVWDTGTMQPLSLALPRTTANVPPVLSPDGTTVFGTANFSLYRVSLPSIDDADRERLASIGEALAGVRIDRLGVTAPVDGLVALNELEKQCQGVKSEACAIVHWLRTPAVKRTISPLSTLSAADYVKPTTLIPGSSYWWAMKARFPEQPALQANPPD